MSKGKKLDGRGKNPGRFSYLNDLHLGGIERDLNAGKKCRAERARRGAAQAWLPPDPARRAGLSVPVFDGEGFETKGQKAARGSRGPPTRNPGYGHLLSISGLAGSAPEKIRTAK